MIAYNQHCKQDRVLINQWREEIINACRQSAQIMANMNKKVHRV